MAISLMPAVWGYKVIPQSLAPFDSLHHLYSDKFLFKIPGIIVFFYIKQLMEINRIIVEIVCYQMYAMKN